MEIWDLTVLAEYDDGYLLVSGPDGETTVMSQQEYDAYLQNREKLIKQ